MRWGLSTLQIGVVKSVGGISLRIHREFELSKINNISYKYFSMISAASLAPSAFMLVVIFNPFSFFISSSIFPLKKASFDIS